MTPREVRLRGVVMLRLFAAVPLPSEIADQLVRLQRGVAGAAWRPRENFHVTLRFFGEIDEQRARTLDEELGDIRAAPFEAALDGAGWFGGAFPTTLWLGLAPSPRLAALATACDRAARRCGLPPEPRAFTPHVTLAYCRGTTAEDAAKFAQRFALFRSEPFWIDRFHLYSSWLGKGPSRYVPEADYPLDALR